MMLFEHYLIFVLPLGGQQYKVVMVNVICVFVVWCWAGSVQ